jgi:hypothetical protein
MDRVSQLPPATPREKEDIQSGKQGGSELVRAHAKPLGVPPLIRLTLPAGCNCQKYQRGS